MSTLEELRRRKPWHRRLYLPSYTVKETARYARVHSSTVTRWYYGASDMRAVLPERERRTPLSYMQLIEVAIVAAFRRAGVPMQRIRKARDYFAREFDAEYPFAEYRVVSQGMHILLDLEGLWPASDVRKVIITDAGGQVAWADLIGGRFDEFDYDLELAIRWHPAGRQSPIVIDPRIAFGAPVIRGVPTWALRGRWRAGESIPRISASYRLSEPEVEDALTFEGVLDAA
jgi:uncharacterized protein (DUF433 family)